MVYYVSIGCIDMLFQAQNIPFLLFFFLPIPLAIYNWTNVVTNEKPWHELSLLTSPDSYSSHEGIKKDTVERKAHGFGAKGV